MRETIRIWLPLAFCLLLSSCARTTTITGPDAEALAVAHSVPIDLVELDDRPLQEQVSFLGRYLLADSFRVSVAENAAQSEWGQQAYVDLIKYRSIGNSTGLGMAISEAATGDLFSQQGSDVALWSSLGIDLVNAVLATRRMSDVSGFFMPKTFSGIEIQSADEATQAAVAFTESRIRDAVAMAGYDISCHLQCEPDSKNRIYRLTRVQDRSGQFAPASLYLYFGYYDLIEMPEKSEDHLLSPLLGYVPAYTSRIGNTWTIYLGTRLKKDNKKDIQVIDRYSRLVTTPLSREIRKSIYSGQRFMFWGSSIAEVRSAAFYIKQEQPGLIYFDDQIYTFADSTGNMIRKPEPISVTHIVR